MHLSVTDLYPNHLQRIACEQQIYKTILYDLFEKIRQKSKEGKYNYHYRLPRIVYGNTNYKISNAIYYIVHELTKGGFIALPDQYACIYIDWSIVKQQIEKPKNKHVRFIE